MHAKAHSNRPFLVAVSSHWVSLAGLALALTALISWMFVLPVHVRGHVGNPYIGILVFIMIPAVFFAGLGLIPLGITLISAGSHTEPGGYTGAGKEKVHHTERGRIVPLAPGASEWAPSSRLTTSATGQFEISDDRPPQELAAVVRRLGYEPVWKDWDSALSA